MQAPEFLVEFINHLPYHQVIELVVWMDGEEDVERSINKLVYASIPVPESVPATDGKEG